jgi:hypothetical protein
MPQLPLPRRAFPLLGLTVFASWGALGGCSNGGTCPNIDDSVVTRADPDADFSRYQTFAIREISEEGAAGAGGAGIPEDVQVNLEVANDAAAEELVLLGLEEVDPEAETPDLWVFSAASTEREEGVNWYCVPDWYWLGYGYYWDPCAWMYPIEFEYTEGTLLVGVADSSTDTPVFGGLLKGVLECDSDLDVRIENGVEAIFDDYPAEE